MFVGAMGVPGGGANMVTKRLLRHMQIICLDSFEDNTLNKIFCSIMDWHFAKGYLEPVARLTKVTKIFGLKKNKKLTILVYCCRNNGSIQRSYSNIPTNASKVTLQIFFKRFFARYKRFTFNTTKMFRRSRQID